VIGNDEHSSLYKLLLITIVKSPTVRTKVFL
jgi:hypothetical protein